MGRYIDYDYSQAVLLPISFEGQIPSFSSEFSLCRLVDHEFYMMVIKLRSRDDDTGRPVIPPFRTGSRNAVKLPATCHKNDHRRQTRFTGLTT